MEFLKNTSMLYVMQYEVYDNHTLVWVEGWVMFNVERTMSIE
jgi:hypothetical protein